MKIKTKELKKLRTAYRERKISHFVRMHEIDKFCEENKKLDLCETIEYLINQELKRRKKFKRERAEYMDGFRKDCGVSVTRKARRETQAIIDRFYEKNKKEERFDGLPTNPNTVHMVIDTMSNWVMGCFYKREAAEKYKGSRHQTIIIERSVE